MKTFIVNDQLHLVTLSVCEFITDWLAEKMTERIDKYI